MAAETDPRPAPRGRDGFTLVEVLVAMVVLAIGLLALEALAIGAAQRVAVANRTTEYTLVATHQLETALEQLRQGQVPVNLQLDLASGGTVQRLVTAAAAVQGGTVYDVEVTVTPPTGGHVTLQPVTVTGRVLFAPTL